MQKPKNPPLVDIGLLIAVTGLHAYESFFLSSSPSICWFCWLLAPYVWCALAILATKKNFPAAVGAVSGIVLDLFAHYEVFIAPSSSTAALSMLFTPMLDAAIVVPVPLFFCAWLQARREFRG